MRSSRRIVASALWLAAALVLAGSAIADATPRVSRDDAAAAYVGSKTCLPCHRAEYEGWLGSDHERAMRVATPDAVLGRFRDASFTHAGITSRFFERDGKLFAHTEGPDGALADFPIEYTFGVEPLQQYLVPFPGGRLQSLTIAWDARPASQGGQRWFSLHPGERIAARDPLHWTGPLQNWNSMCAACHATDLRKRYDAASNEYATSWSELGVACEACHGPGSRHVAWAAAPAGGDAGLTVQLTRPADAAWTIDPKTGNARPRHATSAQSTTEVCAPCHSRRSAIGDDYHPGQPLLDSYLPTLLVEGLYHADGQIDGEVYEYGSFLQSKMYRNGVGCADCHAPHSLKLRAPGNALCAQCHLPAKYDSPAHHFHPPGSAGAACTGCHMPTRTYMEIDARHDHSLRVPRPDLSVEIGTPNACTQCHADRGAAWARDRVRDWYGRDSAGYQTYARALHAGRTDGPNAAALLAALATDAAQPGIARATALELLRARSSPAVIGAVRAGLRDPDPLVRRTAVASLEGFPPAQRPALGGALLGDPIRAVRIEAARQLAAAPAGALGDGLRRRLDRAIAEYVAAQRVDADRPEARTNLGTFYAERGRAAEAKAELETAIALQRGYAPAYINLADLYRAERRDREGERVLRAGLAAAPDDAPLHLALGLLLVRQQRLSEAIGALERAAALRPQDSQYAYVLGIALHSSGRTERALAALSAAATRHPYNADLLLALATINRDAGTREAALAYARRLAAVAPGNPAATRLISELTAAQPSSAPAGAGER
ncbi:MAG: tetratricopeptide repeat protein [Candidatus Binatia bacterium]